MAYLSRILLNPLRKQTQSFIRNPQRLHAAILGGLVPPVTERVLWRPQLHDHALELLVQTESTPSWEHLIEQGGWTTSNEGKALVRPLDPLLPQVVAGREFGFKLRANPSSSVRAPQNATASQQAHLAAQPRRGVRVGHRTASSQLEWFLSRTNPDNHPWGFTATDNGTPTVRLVGREKLSFNKSQGDKRRHVDLDVATYEGVLRVTDAETARATLLAGIGRAKGYGCGLLTLAPVPT